MDSTTATPEYQGRHRDDSITAKASSNARDDWAMALGNVYHPRHSAEQVTA